MTWRVATRNSISGRRLCNTVVKQLNLLAILLVINIQTMQHPSSTSLMLMSASSSPQLPSGFLRRRWPFTSECLETSIHTLSVPSTSSPRLANWKRRAAIWHPSLEMFECATIVKRCQRKSCFNARVRRSTTAMRNVEMLIGQFTSLIAFVVFVGKYARAQWFLVVFVLLLRIVGTNAAKRIRMIMSAFQDVINVERMG